MRLRIMRKLQKYIIYKVIACYSNYITCVALYLYKYSCAYIAQSVKLLANAFIWHNVSTVYVFDDVK